MNVVHIWPCVGHTDASTLGFSRVSRVRNQKDI